METFLKDLKFGKEDNILIMEISTTEQEEMEIEWELKNGHWILTNVKGINFTINNPNKFKQDLCSQLFYHPAWNGEMEHHGLTIDNTYYQVKEKDNLLLIPTDDLDEVYRFITKLPQIREFTDSEFLRHKSKDTVDTYRRSLRVFLKFLVENGTDLKGFQLSDVQSFFEYIHEAKRITNSGAFKSYTPNYINKVYYSIIAYCSLFRQALTEDVRNRVNIISKPSIFEESPSGLDHLKETEMIRSLEDEVLVAKMRGNVMRHKEAVRNLAITVLLLETGIRLEECIALDIDDITLTKNVKTSELRVRGKGNKFRTIPLSKKAREHLENYLAVRENGFDEFDKESIIALFVSARKKRLSARQVERVFAKLGTHPHAARHTFIKRMVNKGTPMPVVQSFSGHTSADMVHRYSKPTNEEKREWLEKKG